MFLDIRASLPFIGYMKWTGKAEEKKKSECHFASELGSVLSGEVGGSAGTVLKENEWLCK